MAQKTYYLEGGIKWAKVHKPDDKYEHYTLDLYLTDDSWKLFHDSGLQLKVRENDEGKFIKLRRPMFKKIKQEIVDIGPPEVLVLNDDGEYEPTKKLIGNGSVGVCKVRVYDTTKGKGHELVTVAVSDLVEYEESVGGDDYPF